MKKKYHFLPSRLLNIEADGGQGLGLFEVLHGADSADTFVRQLKDAAQHYYGAPFRAFVERLAAGRSEAEQKVRAFRDSFIRESVPDSSAGEVKRAADRFALIGAAGELATAYGLTGWKPGEPTAVAARCFHEWLGTRGNAGASDMEAAVRQVRAFIGSNGGSRFQQIRPIAGAGSGGDGDGQIVRDRAGFRRRNSETDETEYLILPETFRNEVCAGHSSQTVVKELDKRGFLVREKPNMTVKPNLPELGRVRVYCVRAAILEGDDC